MNNMNLNINTSELIKRALKYFLEGLVVAVSARYIPAQKINWREIIMIALTAAIMFALLDTWAPSVAFGARFGAGMKIGNRV